MAVRQHPIAPSEFFSGQAPPHPASPALLRDQPSDTRRNQVIDGILSANCHCETALVVIDDQSADAMPKLLSRVDGARAMMPHHSADQGKELRYVMRYPWQLVRTLNY